jgi:hypothetical protein
MAVTCAVFFGSSCFLTTGSANHERFVLETPASVDSLVDFQVPAVLPADDSELFNLTFDKLVLNAIITLYF